ncbi:MAG TPA: FAD-dependent oxidoreductase [Longimicrobiales bacterium]|nr:FAD-dependent oxidoreductase [Longimicrobiales bacterium]
MAQPHVVILGGGPAGVGGAFYLTKAGRASVTVLEQQAVVGGNAGSFEIDGMRVDFGSHRLHHASDPAILADLHSLLGEDLLDRPRRGRIRLRGKWVHFPLKPVDLVLRLDKGFAAGSLRDMVVGALTNGKDEGDTFASVLRANLGPTICDHFYFPYARKMWGLPPDRLSAIQARKRVSAGSFGKLLKRLIKAPGAGRFHYPRNGYGQITEALADAAVGQGAVIQTRAKVTSLEQRTSGRGWTVTAECEGVHRSYEADYVWSTLPAPVVARMMRPEVPAEVQSAAASISYRAMVLAYLVLDVDQFTTTDAHYFPEENIAMTRLSEPKNYAASSEPKGRTVLCAELPCQPEDSLWTMTDDEVGRLVADDLAQAGIPLARPPIRVVTRRLKHAYPIYRSGYEVPFATLDEWGESLPDFLQYGRQALFAHDNTHHGLYMARAATDCLTDAGFDRAKWQHYRDVFATHVVED